MLVIPCLSVSWQNNPYPATSIAQPVSRIQNPESRIQNLASSLMPRILIVDDSAGDLQMIDGILKEVA
ncbi:MAG: hypothetical protein OES79_10820, partial [Planctomycetota bacterium]|nr:hypothetical protein [Planctomycetota bacterium]